MSEHWKKVEALFDAALDRPAGARAAWLREACGGDDALRREVEELVAAHERAGGILDAPPLLPRGLVEKEAEEAVRERHVGPYRLLRELGRGGMGAVYLAERDDAQFSRRVAVKVLRQGLAGEDYHRRFAAERQILAALHHPHIARLYGGGVTDAGRPYYVMEWVPGRPIDRYCDAKRLPVEERLRLFRDVCDAVEYAHRNLVVHRDLKPANVLVTEDDLGRPQVKLLDFGIAKLLDAEAAGLKRPAPVTRTGMRLMTPAYASPEQVSGGPITTASDVYALGVLLYELLTGHRPYHVTGCPPGEVERVICEEAPVRPSTAVAKGGTVPAESGSDANAPEEVGRARATTVRRLRKTLRGDLDTICMKALRKEPERRYGSAAALAEDLGRYLEGRSVEARPDSPGYHARTFVRRHRWGVAAAALLVLLLAGYAATVTLQSRRIAEERDRARLEAMKAAHVKEFLIGLFGRSHAAGGGADSSRTGTVTVEEVLAGGAERVRRDLAGHPEIRAEMLSALGAVYVRLDRHRAARPLLEEALAARRAHVDAPHPSVATALVDLADLERRADRPARAETLYREALRLRLRLRGEGHVAVAETQHALASLLAAGGRTDEAMALYAEALPVYRAVLGGAHGQTASLMTNLAALKRDVGDDAAAAALYRDALGMEQERLGRGHPRVAVLRAELGACLTALGRYEEAERHLHASHAALKDHGDQGGQMRTVLEHLVALYEVWGKPRPASSYQAQLAATTR